MNWDPLWLSYKVATIATLMSIIIGVGIATLLSQIRFPGREFVDALNLEEVEISWARGENGRPAYAAQLLLKIWLYGYFERTRSSRRLEKACRDHMGFIWLAGMHAPDHNTLNNFFRANKKEIRNLFKTTVRVAVEADMVGFVLHAVDGTKIAASVAGRGAWHKKRLLKFLKKP